jgi:hypothetical protein
VIPAVEIDKLSAAAQRIFDAKTPVAVRQMAARGIAPGLKPADALTVVAILSEQPSTSPEGEAMATAAKGTLAKLPLPLLQGALGPDLPPGVIDLIAPTYVNDAIMERILGLPQITGDTVAMIASRCNEMVSELVATNEERLLANPVIIEKLYLNKSTRMSTANRALELAIRNKIKVEGIPAFEEAAAALADELIPEPSPEPTFSDTLVKETIEIGAKLATEALAADTHVTDEASGEEQVKDKFKPVHARIADMSMSEKIRTAMVGSASERAILVRDNNKVVAKAAVKSPQIQENEAVRIAAMRNVSDEVLGELARSPKWKQSYQIKLNLVQNPRTPPHISQKLIAYLYEHDLKALAKSKNVTGQVIMAAKQHLQRKQKK